MNASGGVPLPVRHARWVLVGAVCIAVLATLSASRLTPNVSLGAMLADDAPSAVAMQRIESQFRAMDELLLLARLPADSPGDTVEGTRLLVEFARSLEQHVRAVTELDAMVARVHYGLGEDAPERAFVRRVVVPNMLLYLDDEEFQQAVDRLSIDAMRAQLAQNEAMIAAPGPAAGALARQLLRDPLRLRELAPKPGGMAPGLGGEYALSRDGRSLLVRIAGREPASDLAFSSAFYGAMRDAAARVNSDGLTLQFAGSYAIADASHQAVRTDMIRSIVGSILLIQLFLLVVYRRLLSFVLAIAPVALAILAAFGTFALVASHVTPITAVIGAVLAGLGIDYCVHLLSHYEQQRGLGDAPREAGGHAIRSVGPRTTAAAATTLIGFLAISLSQLTALREFSILGALGLALALAASLTVLPALLVMTDRRAAARAGEANRSVEAGLLLDSICVHRRACMVTCSVLLVLCLGVLVSDPRSAVRIEADLTSMHPQPNPALDLQRSIAADFGGAADTMLLHSQAESERSLIALAHAATDRLEHHSARDAGVSDVFSLATLLPEPVRAQKRIAVLATLDPDRVVRDFDRALNESVFDSDAYAEYAAFLRELVRPRMPTLDDLRSYPALAATLLPQPERGSASSATHEAIAMVMLQKLPANRSQRGGVIDVMRSQLQDLPNVTLTGLSVIGHDTEAAIARDLLVLLLVAAAAVLAFLAVLFRRPLDVLLTLLPTAFAVALLLAVMRLAPGESGFNMINLIALPLLCGIGVDDGIFMMSIARRHRGASRAELARRMRSSIHAVMVTSVTTMLAFGSLVFTSMPAIRSLGWMAAVGVGACLVATLGLLVPILLGRCDDGAPAAK